MKKKKEHYLYELLSYLEINANEFAYSLSFNRTDRIYNVLNGHNGISPNLAKIITEKHPIVSYSWLLTGEGQMLNEVNVKNDTTVYVQLLPIAAIGGSLNDFIVSIKDNDCEKIISPIKGADWAITVSGDSMAPEYPSGSQVLIKKINEKAFIDWGKVYVLDTCNGTVIKILTPSEKKGYVKCASINPDPKYAPFEISLENDVYGVYRVMLCMSVK